MAAAVARLLALVVALAALAEAGALVALPGLPALTVRIALALATLLLTPLRAVASALVSRAVLLWAITVCLVGLVLLAPLVALAALLVRLAALISLVICHCWNLLASRRTGFMARRTNVQFRFRDHQPQTTASPHGQRQTNRNGHIFQVGGNCGTLPGERFIVKAGERRRVPVPELARNTA